LRPGRRCGKRSAVSVFPAIDIVAHIRKFLESL
jgi:hypothetical protein